LQDNRYKKQQGLVSPAVLQKHQYKDTLTKQLMIKKDRMELSRHDC